MRIPRVFTRANLHADNEIALDEQQSRYLLKVLRLKKGFQLTLFNGDGFDYPATIVEANPGKLQVRLGQPGMPEPAAVLSIHLGLGLSKGDRFETALQKATELGVTEITPLITEFNAVRLDEQRLEKKQQHWQSIIESACEQSERGYLPILNPACSFEAWHGFDRNALKLTLHPGSDKTFSNLPKQSNVVLLIGPEGGFSATEVKLADHWGFEGIRFGRHILRTETAAIAAIAALQAMWGW
jgi:16S rRNA (uracil1498-N3)-methyltransferase